MKYDDTVILIYAKAPEAGRVNTRLIPAIGVAAATQLQEDLLFNRLESISQSELCEMILVCAPDTSHICFKDCESRYGVSLLRQDGNNLGQRLSNGIKQVLPLKKNVIVVGTDAPALDGVRMEEAIIALSSHDVVMVPAEDGGYVLIGMSAHYPELFEEIEWGSDKVMAQTEAKISSQNLELCRLPTSWDIDREEDYKRYLETLC